MITLTNPKQVNSILGNDAALVGYDRFVLSPITFIVKGAQVNAGIVLTSTASPEMTPISGSLAINLTTGVLEITIPQVTFFRRVTLSGGQITTVQGWMNSAQTNLEQGLINVTALAGTQSAGI